MKLILSISLRKVTQVLTSVIIFLSVISLGLHFAATAFGYRGILMGLVKLFDVGKDNNIPTWYSSFALLLCSCVIALIAWTKDINRGRYVLHWKVLSAIFVFLSIDEVAMMHEQSGKLLKVLNIDKSSGSGFPMGWFTVAIPIILVLALTYLKFLAHLPAKTKLLFGVAGTIFLGGAIGTEMVGKYNFDLYGRSINLTMITAVEEFMEMLGIVVFLYALLSYLGLYVQEVQVHIGEARRQTTLRAIDEPILEERLERSSRR